MIISLLVVINYSGLNLHSFTRPIELPLKCIKLKFFSECPKLLHSFGANAWHLFDWMFNVASILHVSLDSNVVFNIEEIQNMNAQRTFRLLGIWLQCIRLPTIAFHLNLYICIKIPLKCELNIFFESIILYWRICYNSKRTFFFKIILIYTCML